MEKLSAEIVRLLKKVRNGDKNALDRLYTSVYDNLRIIAHYLLKNEASGHTLQTTEIVNEAYLRLLGTNTISRQDKAVFIGIVVKCMRRVLVDYARRKMRQKRGGGYEILPLHETIFRAEERPELLIALDSALERLALLNDRHSKIVELRYIAGYKIDEVAELLDISPETVSRDWRVAKAWLQSEIRGYTKNDA